MNATFDMTEYGKRADLDLSLSAQLLPNSKLVISPAYYFHAWLDEYDMGSSHSLFMESSWVHNKWEIRPSAGFSWEGMEDFTEDADFRLEVIRNF